MKSVDAVAVCHRSIKTYQRWADKKATGSARVRYRTSEQVVVIVAFAVVLAVVGVATAHEAASRGQEIFQLVATAVIALLAAALPLRSGLWISEGQVEVRNPLSKRLLWTCPVFDDT